MENQPRPWFRQPTQSRIDPTPTPTPQPGPTPLLRRSSFLLARSLVPPMNQPPQSQPSPANQPLQLQRQPSPEPPVPTRSPPIQQSPAAQLTPPTRFIASPLTATPPQSPKIIRPSNPTPPPSPKANHMESSANSFIMQEEAKGGRPTTPPTKREDHKHAAAVYARGNNNAKPKDESEKSVITIAGENMGAYMDLGFPPGYHQHGRKQQQQGIETPVRDEGKSGEKDKSKPNQGKPTAALVNSNVQSVNNSILFNTSCTTRSPGVHVTLATRHAPRGEPALPSKGIKAALPESRGH